MRRLCVAFALLALAGCGNSDPAALPDKTDSAPAPEAPAPGPVVGGGGGAAGPEPLPDPVGRRLSRTCARAQKPLGGVADPGDLAGVAANASTEIGVLGALQRRLRAARIDGRRREALRQYRIALRNEIEVDRLIVRAAKARDGAAVADLVDQNDHNRDTRRQLADEVLEAAGCRPRARITD